MIDLSMMDATTSAAARTASLDALIAEHVAAYDALIAACDVVGDIPDDALCQAEIDAGVAVCGYRCRSLEEVERKRAYVQATPAIYSEGLDVHLAALLQSMC